MQLEIALPKIKPITLFSVKLSAFIEREFQQLISKQSVNMHTIGYLLKGTCVLHEKR